MKKQRLTREEKQAREKALSSLLSAKAFPGRTSLYLKEVAAAIGCTEQHVSDLVFAGELGAVDVTAKRSRSFKQLRGVKTARGNIRIPVRAYDDFLRRRQA